jgi:hypothetical protein
MAGIELADLALDRMLNVVVALAIDDRVVTTTLQVDEKRAELYNRERARSDFVGKVRGTGRAGGLDPHTWDRSTWGLLPEHRSATQVAMAAVGGPAPPRSG